MVVCRASGAFSVSAAAVVLARLGLGVVVSWFVAVCVLVPPRFVRRTMVEKYLLCFVLL